jgi:uncharacterized protein (TIGR02453 family)
MAIAAGRYLARPLAASVLSYAVPVTFRGFSDTAFSFYERLAADNTRTFWLANKSVYLAEIRGPMDELLAELEEFGPFHVFRPNKDVRFAKDKTPYKDHIGAYGESEGGAGYYVHLSSTGMLAGSGYYAMAPDQLERFRQRVDADATGGQLEKLAAGVVRAGLELGAIDELKTAPRGYPKDHPRIAYLRRKGLIATRSWPVSSWMHTKRTVERVREAWSIAAPLNAWLDQNVGPSTQAPDDLDR